MKEFLLGLIDQSSEQAAQRDMGDYDPVTGTLKRSGMEKFGDFFRGGPDSVNEAAKELQVKSLQPLVKQIKGIPGAATPVVDYSTTGADLTRQLTEAQSNYARTERNKNFETNPVEQARIKQQGEALNYQKSRDIVKDKEAADLLRANIDKQLSDNTFRTAQLDITRQQEANRMAEETRRYDERRADSKKERMAALIAGLANLGGAFTI